MFYILIIIISIKLIILYKQFKDNDFNCLCYFIGCHFEDWLFLLYKYRLVYLIRFGVPLLTFPELQKV